MMPKRITSRILLFAGSVLGAFYLYSCFLSFSDSIYFKRGSLHYWILMDSKVIEDFPIIPDARSIEYRYGAADGPKPPTYSVFYVTTASYAEAGQAVAKYLTDRGFDVTWEIESEIYGEREDDWIDVTFSIHDLGEIRVSASFFKQFE